MSAPLTPGVRRALWRIPVLLAEDLYATDAGLCAELGLELRDLRTAVAILYRQRKVDRIGVYLVAPARPREPIRLPDAPDRAA
jgi:hypothetical protein